MIELDLILKEEAEPLTPCLHPCFVNNNKNIYVTIVKHILILLYSQKLKKFIVHTSDLQNNVWELVFNLNCFRVELHYLVNWKSDLHLIC